ncbi:12854_t:CDS:2, partial [Acaulospora colombiana]
ASEAKEVHNSMTASCFSVFEAFGDKLHDTSGSIAPVIDVSVAYNKQSHIPRLLCQFVSGPKPDSSIILRLSSLIEEPFITFTRKFDLCGSTSDQARPHQCYEYYKESDNNNARTKKRRAKGIRKSLSNCVTRQDRHGVEGTLKRSRAQQWGEVRAILGNRLLELPYVGFCKVRKEHPA